MKSLLVFAAAALGMVALAVAPVSATTLEGSCKLVNTKKAKAKKAKAIKYEGRCVVTQDTGVDHPDFHVELGNGKSFHFADKGFGFRLNGDLLIEVAFEDRGDVAVYRWDRWKLVVPSEL